MLILLRPVGTVEAVGTAVNTPLTVLFSRAGLSMDPVLDVCVRVGLFVSDRLVRRMSSRSKDRPVASSASSRTLDSKSSSTSESSSPSSGSLIAIEAGGRPTRDGESISRSADDVLS